MIEKIRRKHQIVKAVKYGRFSSDMQREESIEAQDMAMEQFAKNHNITIVGEYYDRAKSGTGADREEFQRLLKDSSKHEFHFVLVHKVDRFARNRQDSMNARFQLKRHGVSVVSTSQLYDSESPEGMMMEAMLEAMAEYYSKNLANEVEKGKRMNAMKGLHVGGIPPLGFDVDRKTMKLVINEHEAQAVQLIFQMASEDKRYKEIMDALHLRGFRTKLGNKFGYNSIHDIMKNEKYTGTYVYSRATSKDMYGRRNGHSYKDEDEMVKVENGCPAIVTKEIFQLVQKRMTVQKRCAAGGRGKAKTDYLLSGKIRCGICGSTYEGLLRHANYNHPERVSYRCGKRNKKADCKNSEIERSKLEDFVLDKLASLVFDDAKIPHIIACYQEYQSEQDKESLLEIKLLKSHRSKIESETANIVNVISQTGSIALASRLQELEQELISIDTKLVRLEEEVASNAVTEGEIKAAFEKARELLKQKTLPNTKELIRIFVDKVVMFTDRIEVSFNIGFPTEIFKKEKSHHAPVEGLHDAIHLHTIELTNAMVLDGGEGEI